MLGCCNRSPGSLFIDELSPVAAVAPFESGNAKCACREPSRPVVLKRPLCRNSAAALGNENLTWCVEKLPLDLKRLGPSQEVEVRTLTNAGPWAHTKEAGICFSAGALLWKIRRSRCNMACGVENPPNVEHKELVSCGGLACWCGECVVWGPLSGLWPPLENLPAPFWAALGNVEMLGLAREHMGKTKKTLWDKNAPKKWETQLVGRAEIVAVRNCLRKVVGPLVAVKRVKNETAKEPGPKGKKGPIF